MLNVIAVGNFTETTGYSEVARNLMYNFVKQNPENGYQLLCCSSDYDMTPLEEELSIFLKTFQSTIIYSEYDLVLYFASPDSLDMIRKGIQINAKKRVIITAFEGTQINERWTKICNEFLDAIAVPSSANKRAFEEYVELPVWVIPHGLKSIFLNQDLSERRVKESNEEFYFITNLDWRSSFRKGLDMLFHAYFRSFSVSEPVTLIVKTNKFAEGKIEALSRMIVDFYRMRQSPKLAIVTETLSWEQMLALYRQADCYVSPYRGGGFELGILEAMACGLPVIVTQDPYNPDRAWDGPGDFVSSENGWLVKPATAVAPKSSLPIYDRAMWIQADQAHLAFLMRYAFERRKEGFEKGMKGYEIAQKYSWTSASKILSDLVKSLQIGKEG